MMTDRFGKVIVPGTRVLILPTYDEWAGKRGDVVSLGRYYIGVRLHLVHGDTVMLFPGNRLNVINGGDISYPTIDEYVDEVRAGDRFDGVPVAVSAEPEPETEGTEGNDRTEVPVDPADEG